MLDDRPAAASGSTGDETSNPRSSLPTASWAFAARLARREVRRRPGRTVLVMLLIAVPVIGMALGSIVYRTGVADRSQSFAREYGTADFILGLNGNSSGRIDISSDAVDLDVLDLPAGTRSMQYLRAWTLVRADVAGVITSTTVEFSDVDLSDPIIAGTLDIQRGRVPTGPGEVLLSADVADRFSVDVGDSLRLVRPDLELDVVGVGRDQSYYGTSLMVVPGFDRSLFGSAGGLQFDTLVDLPDDLSAQQVAAIVQRLQLSASESQPYYVRPAVDQSGVFTYEENSAAKDLAWGWVAGVVAFVAVGIVIAAAFATSARRQLVTIGQLSANGASQRLVRRTMGMQGMWTGLLGALLGLFVATVGMVVAFRTGLFARFSDHDVASLHIVALDLAVILITAVAAATIAALVPARSASRIPVLSALAGRRPVATPPKWMAPAGVALFCGGLFLLGGAAGTPDGGDFAAMLAVIGSLGVIFGMVCASPLIVAAVGRVGSRGGGVVRLAARSLERSRARSAAVLTAIAVVGSLAVAGATAAGTARNSDTTYVPDLRTVSVFFGGDFGQSEELNVDGVYDAPPVVPTPLPVDVRQGIEQVLPDAEWTAITQTIDDPFPYRLDTGETIFPDGFDPNGSYIGSIMVADENVVDKLDLSAEQRRILDDAGVLATVPWYDGSAVLQTPDGFVDVDLSASLRALGFDGPIDTEEEQARANEIAEVEGRLGGVFVSPEFVEANGLATGVSWYLVENPTDLTSAQRDAIFDLQPGYVGEDAFTSDASAPGYEELGVPTINSWFPSAEYPNLQVPWALIQAGVALASLVMVLMVVAIGLSLAATESRDERDVLHAVGAAPRTLRRVAATKAWVLTTGAAVVAIPAGYITVFVVTQATGSSAPVPFALIGALLVVIPLLAAGATLMTSSIAQHFKPVTYSTFGVD